MTTEQVVQSMNVGGNLTAAQVRDHWYTYDAENRIRISGGSLSGAAFSGEMNCGR